MKTMPQEKQEKKSKSTEPPGYFGITRRTALKMTAAAGAVTMLTSKKSWAFDLPPVPPEPADCTPNPGHSPATTPFVQALPIMPAAVPTILNPQPTQSANTAAGEAARADHQILEPVFPFVQYDISVQPALHQFHPELPPSYTWGYNRIYPGPTFINVYGIPIVVRFRNNLPVNHQGYGVNTHTTHMHNGHTASESDGFASDFWGPGFFRGPSLHQCLCEFRCTAASRRPTGSDGHPLVSRSSPQLYRHQQLSRSQRHVPALQSARQRLGVLHRRPR